MKIAPMTAYVQDLYCHFHILGDKVNFIYSTPECYTQAGFQTCLRLVNRYGYIRFIA